MFSGKYLPHNMPIPKLVEFIEDHYHKRLLDLISELLELAKKIEKVHGAHPSWKVGTYESLDNVCRDLKYHMDEEERMLFSLLKNGVTKDLPYLELLNIQHADHSLALKAVHKIYEDLKVPSDACTSWRKFVDGMLTLENVLVEHFEIEEKILIPALIEKQQ